MNQEDTIRAQNESHYRCVAWVEPDNERLLRSRPVNGGTGVIKLHNDPETERPYRVVGDLPETINQEDA